MCTSGLNICLDRERHNGPFIRFFPAPGWNAFFPEQSFAELLWAVAQVKGFDCWTFLGFFSPRTGCFRNAGCTFGS